ncbi:MAG: lipopolysaccharide biosynthesis protein [Chloroflexi bacterium]|nr:lipopolysaccharide biosynthesis protein [Chloroflexota bacterium]
MKRLVALLTLVLLFFSVQPVHADGNLRVFYVGAEGSVKTALELAKFTLVDDPALADVFVLNGEIPADGTILSRTQSGEAGLVLILGPNLSEAQVGGLLGIPLTLAPRDDAVSITSIPLDDPLVTEIIWNGAPQVRERFEVQTPLSSVQPLVTNYENGEWILWQARPNQYVVNAFLDDVNPQIQEWAYYNYLIYHLVERAAGQTPLSFAAYPISPVPHTTERNILFAVMGLMLVTSFGTFFFVRRYSQSHPEALDQIVSDRSSFQSREESTSWEQVGFHRPLSGFLVALSMGVMLFIPLIIYQNLILPSFILPSAQALGIWGRVTQFFNLAWFFFDMGTSVAFVKYMSQYRVNDPQRGIKFGQVFVWWQLLSGAVQVALVIALAATVAPQSAYALYAWSVIIHAFIQIPGFYRVFLYAFSGFQRNDYARYLDLGLNVLLPMIVQPIFVTIAYAWGRANPAFGGAMGGLLGLGIAAYAAELITFLLGFWLYRRIGLNVRVLFLAHFDWEIVKTSFRFGVFEMLGSAAWSFGQAAEIWITQSRLINYAEIWGNWVLAQNFVFAFNVVSTLTDGAMPSISEAISHGRKLLSQYYTVMIYKWSGMISAFLAAVLLAVGPRFIVGASGIEFSRAAVYAVPLLIWGAVQYPSWVGDQVQLGSNKPYLKSTLVFGEQIIRVVLAWILLERYQVTALVIAYFVGLLTKDFVAYFVNHKYCFPQRFFFWQSAGAPLLAAGLHYLLMDRLSALIWRGDQITSIVIFFIGILPSLVVYMFLYGLVGGWDDATLAEFDQATAMTGPLRGVVTWLMLKPTALGARLSPLNNRFPISIRAAAMEEARSLTEEKVRL